MSRKSKIISVIIFLVFIVTAFVLERSDAEIIESGILKRGEYGQGNSEQELVVSADGILEDYTYDLIIEEQKLTETQKHDYIKQAVHEIEQNFCGENSSLECIQNRVNIKDNYVDGIVKTEWQFSPNGFVADDGSIVEENLSDKGTLIKASVEMECENRKELYQFSFLAYPGEKTQEDELIIGINEYFEKEYEEAGIGEVQLPDEINGIKLSWSAPRQYLVVKVIFFGVILMVLLYFYRQNFKKKVQKEAMRALELDYPDMVGKLAILLGSGMTLKKAWNIISARYSYNRQKNAIEPRRVYEEMIRTNREISDGEAEVKAYQKFADRTGSNLYQRLIRLLIQNIQKGNREIHNALEEETLRAFEQRKNLIKIMGEEAGTKMLFPLILMLIIVMAIVIAPAMLNLKL